MNDNIKAIWNKHIEVQEQLLRARAIPIPIDTTSIRIAGEKLFLTIDERNRTDKVLSQIAEAFGIGVDELKISEGCFIVDTDKSNNVDSDTKRALSEIAENNHIKFRPNPIVDGIIKQKNISLINILKRNKCNYSFDKKERLQISISDLKRIQSELETSDVQLPETASAIFRFKPTPFFFLERMMPYIPWENRIYVAENDDSVEFLSNSFVLKNKYLTQDLLQYLNEQFGLSLYKYVFTFHINKTVISKYNPKNSHHILPEINDDGCSFSFVTKIMQKPKELMNSYFEEQFEFGLKYTRLKRFFDNFFGKENVSFDSEFRYRCDMQQFSTQFLPKQTNWEEPFWKIILQSLQLQGISISQNYEIGVDFNWQKESLKDILTKISSVCPYISLSFFDNHRCNVDLKFNNESLTEIENRIRESFPSIQFHKNEKGGLLYFFQEYFDRTKRNQIARSLNDELNLLNSSDYSYEVFSIPPDKDKYYLTIDTDSLQESLTDTVRDLRGCEFKVGDISIGKLFRINYPQLTFDISSSEKDKITYYANNNLFGNITPDLTGDLEKIARLKKSFEAISSGVGLLNPRLSDFIFDASKAETINEVDCYLDSRGEFYNDINDNLLNRKINESQKKAIIKTLLAKDLSLIQGPPGTGKSTAIAEIIWQHIRKNPKERILLTSETNLAVDNAIARVVNTTHNLVKPIRFGEDERLEMEGKQFNIDTLRAWVENVSITYSEEEEDIDEPNKESDIHQKIILENWLSNISRRIDASQMDESICSLWKNMLQNPSKEIRQIAFDKYIHNCNVVGATCSSIGDKNTKGNPTSFFRTYCELFGAVKNITYKDGKSFSLFNGKIKFDTVIQDESSKATPAELSLPLIYGKKNIIIGDHRQLPPLLDKEEFLSSLKFLLNKIDDKQQISEIKKLQKFVQVHFDEMEVSHFQRLFESIDDSLKGVFNQQYRMHPAINEVIKQFYVEDGGLFCGLDEAQVEAPDVTNPQSRYHGLNIDGLIEPKDHVIWIDTKTPEMLVGTSRVNYGEVEAIRSILTKMQNSESFKHYQSLWNNDEDKQIGLISFYGKQIKLLKSLRSDFKDIPIRISTVDRFQGMERNIIIVSMVRSSCITADKNQNADYELYPDLGFASQNDLGFAQSPNRLNVALSRAKRLLIIVGNSDLFRRKHIYDNVYQCIQNSTNGKIINAEEL
jgi:hypothetical protein